MTHCAYVDWQRMKSQSETLQDLFDQYAGSDNVVDYRELQLILNQAFSQGKTSAGFQPSLLTRYNIGWFSTTPTHKV